MVKFEEYKFHYSFTGSRDQPPILFLHGFMGNSNDFNSVMALLADHFYCIAVDLPGHGNTLVSGGEECYTMPNTARALLCLLDSLNIEKCFLVGYSMGGRLALYMSLHFPNCFAKVVLESASPGLKTDGERLARIQHDAKLANQLETSDFKSFLLNWYEQPIFNNLKQHPQFVDLFERRLQNNPLELARSLRQMGTGCQPSLWTKLADNKIPLLLLVGEHDDKFISINAAMTKICKLAQIKIIKGCDHNIHFEQINKWVTQVRDFF